MINEFCFKRFLYLIPKRCLMYRSLSIILLFCTLLTACKKEEVQSDQKVLLTFSFTKAINSALPTDIAGVISGRQVSFSLPAGTNVNALKATFSISPLATLSVNGRKQENGQTVNDFSSPVTYRVTAEDGTTTDYLVTVTVTKSSEKQLTGFSFAFLSPAVSATIDQTNRKIEATVPSDLSISALIPTITLSTNATVAPASGVAQNFINPVSYTVTAQDGGTQIYEVRVLLQARSTAPVGIQDKSTRFIYMIPTDKQYNPDYEKAIARAALHLQTWYKQQTGGYTFKLNNPIVEVYKGKQSSQWYSETKNGNDPSYYYWYNTFNESPSFGMRYPDPNYTWIIYCDAQGGGAGSTGFAILPAEDFVGLNGQHKEPVSRWIGGLGHEMGHAFSLPHPTVSNALMLYGYAQYPTCILLPEEIETLKKLPYFFKTP